MSYPGRIINFEMIYALIKRFDGPTDEINADGTTNWARQ